MKRKYLNQLRLLLIYPLILLMAVQAGAQNTGHAGQTSVLSVEEIPPNIYLWELYSEASGLNFATTSGNCTPDKAYFTSGNAGPSVTVMWVKPGVYFFKVTAWNAEGCMNLKVGKMEVLHNLPTASFAQAPEICAGDFAVLTVVFTGTPPFSFTYTGGADTITVSGITDYTTDLIVSPPTTTDYFILSVIDAGGIPNEAVVGPATVIVNQLPQIITVNVLHSVDNQPTGSVEILAGGYAPPLKYSIDGTNWQLSNIFGNLMPGDYTIWVRDAHGCMVSQTVSVHNIVTGQVKLMAGTINGCVFTPVEVPVIAIGFENIVEFTLELEYDTDIIEYVDVVNINNHLTPGFMNSTMIKRGLLSITFEAPIPLSVPPDEQLFLIRFESKGIGNCLLDWQSPRCIFRVAGGYPVPTIYTHGEVSIKPSPKLLVSGEGRYCEGKELTLNAVSQDNQNINYLWQAPDGSTFNGSAWPLGNLGLNHSGIYTLTATNSYGCDTIVKVVVTVNEIPEVSLAVADTICMREPIWLEPGIGYTSYLWHDGSVQAQYFAMHSGDYWVEVTDNNGCKNIATVTLIPCDVELLIPNAFTPNGDGLNDEFGPIAPPDMQLANYIMLIYNKWGQLLYETKDITKGWDGTFKGNLCPMDVYTYVIIYDLPSFYRDPQPRRIQGSATLVR